MFLTNTKKWYYEHHSRYGCSMHKHGKYNLLGDNCKMGENIAISNYVEIRDNCEIGDWTVIGSHVVMGSGTRIGKGCMIHGGAFFAEEVNLDGIKKPCTLEDNVKLSTNVKIMGGVRIGQNSIIGANSTVFEDVPAYEVWVGTPAKKLRDLKQGEIIV